MGDIFYSEGFTLSALQGPWRALFALSSRNQAGVLRTGILLVQTARGYNIITFLEGEASKRNQVWRKVSQHN